MTDSQHHTATAPGGATTARYLSRDREGFVAADVEAIAGGIGADVDGSVVEIVAAWAAKVLKTKCVRSGGGSRPAGGYPRRRGRG